MRLLEPANAVQIWVGLGNYLIVGTPPRPRLPKTPCAVQIDRILKKHCESLDPATRIPDRRPRRAEDCEILISRDGDFSPQ